MALALDQQLNLFLRGQACAVAPGLMFWPCAAVLATCDVGARCGESAVLRLLRRTECVLEICAGSSLAIHETAQCTGWRAVAILRLQIWGRGPDEASKT